MCFPVLLILTATFFREDLFLVTRPEARFPPQGAPLGLHSGELIFPSQRGLSVCVHALGKVPMRPLTQTQWFHPGHYRTIPLTLLMYPPMETAPPVYLSKQNLAVTFGIGWHDCCLRQE